METTIQLQEILNKLGIDIETVESVYYSHLSDQLIIRHQGDIIHETEEEEVICEMCGETL